MTWDHGGTLVVAAMREEVTGLRSRLAGRHRVFAGDEGHVVEGRIGKQLVRLVVTGEGPRRATEGLRTALATGPARRLIVIGFSGALTRELPPGTLVVPDEIRGTGDLCARPSGAEVRRACALLGARPVTTVSSSHLLLEPGARAWMRARHARGRISVVDLESGAYAAVARNAGIPWFLLRTVSDGFDETLPLFFEGCRHEDGSLDRLAIAWRSLLRPGVWPILRGLRARAQACARTLADAVERVLAEA